MEKNMKKSKFKKILFVLLICIYAVLSIVVVSSKITNTESTSTHNQNTEYFIGTKTLSDDIDIWDLFPTFTEVTFSTINPTNEDVIATIHFNERVTILSSDVEYTKIDARTYSITFTENDIHSLTFKDFWGHKGKLDIEVTWIDRTTPTAEVEYSTTEITNENVIATLTFSEGVSILNENINAVKVSDTIYTINFNKNDEYIIDYIDKAGNKNSIPVKVSCIDKDTPTVNVKFNTTNTTNEDVIATLEFNENVIVSSNDTQVTKLTDFVYNICFTENNKYTVDYTDIAGNKGTVIVEVSCIDKTIPEVNITYSNDKLTNENVIATLNFTEDVTILNTDINLNKLTDSSYTIEFTENGEFKVEFTDEAGNINYAIVKVSCIDKVAPVVNVTYSTTEPTNENVTATLEFNEPVTILNKDINLTKVTDTVYTIEFEENAEYEINFVDNAGNTNLAKVNVSYIDKTAPIVNVKLSTTEPTNNDVVATLTFDEDTRILNDNLNINQIDNKTYEIIFNENAEYTIEFEDTVGNKSSTLINISCIDKVVPVANIKYNTTEPTNGNVTATIEFSELVTILTEDIDLVKVSDNIYTIELDKNAEYTIDFADKAGNKNSVPVKVSCIDKDTPTVNVKFNTTNITNEDVIATLEFNENVIVSSNDTQITKLTDSIYNICFTENNKYTVDYTDIAGNKGTVVVEVSCIDKTIPEVDITYSNDKLTNENVIATLNFTEDVTILNTDINLNKLTDSSYTIEFKENGEFKVEFKDEAGNINYAIVKVSCIDKVAPVVNVTYSITEPTNENVTATLEFNEPVTILNKDINLTKVTDTIYTIEFEENAEYEISFVDNAGNTNLAKVNVSCIDKTAPTVDIKLSTTEPTNNDVVATLTFDEETKILNDNLNINQIDNKTYEIIFSENAEYTIEFEDTVGNKSSTSINISCIDKVIPVANIKYSTTEPTNGNVTATIEFSELVTILTEDIDLVKVSDNIYTIELDKNAEYTIDFADKAGNKNSVPVKVSCIDKDTPTVNVKFNTTNTTNEDVIATLEFNENVIVSYNDTQITKLTDSIYNICFTENNKYTVDYTDIAGNKGTVIVEVSCIDKTIPEAHITYSNDKLTNENVIATLNFTEDVTILNTDINLNKLTDSSYTIEFTKNGEFKVEFKDEAGNINYAIVKVSCIDKVAPVVNVTYSTTEPTNENVTATLEFNEPVTVLNKDINLTKVTDTIYTIEFEQNAEYEINFVDNAGNTNLAKVNVSNIDKTTPTVDVKLSTTEPTNNDVVATLTFDEETKILNDNLNINQIDNKTYEIIFSENAEYIVEFEDIVGNKSSTSINISCIDKVVPVANIKYSTTEPTNENVTATIEFSEFVTILTEDIDLVKVSDNIYTIELDKNVDYTIEFKDIAGNINTANIKVSCIDKDAPLVNTKYNTTKPTNTDVIATLNFNEDVTILNEDTNITKVSDTIYNITFTENNSEYIVEFIDKAGNKGTTTISVTNIDKIAPMAELEYSTTEQTEDSVTVTLKPNEKVTVLTNNGNDTYTFENNGEFTFEFTDEAGNKSSITAKVDWIRKKNEFNLLYDINEITNSDVTVTLNSKYPVEIKNNNGNNTYTFTDNGKFIFEYIDQYGETGTVEANVNWIDKVAPTANLEYSITENTTNPVMVTLNPSEDVTIINNNGNRAYVFTENGEFTFEFVDNAGNYATATAKVDNIVTIPGVSILYDLLELTNTDVIARVVIEDGIITIKNNNGNDSYTFKENGEFTFEYIDQYGNEGTITARVDWIKKVPYEEPKEDEKNPVNPEQPEPEDTMYFPIINSIPTYELSTVDNEPLNPNDLPQEDEKAVIPEENKIEEKKKEDEIQPQIQMQKQEKTDTQEKKKPFISATAGLVIASTSVISILVILLLILL